MGPLVFSCSSPIDREETAARLPVGVDSAADASQVDHTSVVAVYRGKRREIKRATLD